MKNNILKSIFISLILVLGVSNAWGEKIYFKPWSNWKNDARLAAYFYGSGTESWSSFKQIGSSEYYVCDIPSGSYTHVIFCRMNPSATTNNWNNKYNQSAGDKKIALKSNALYKQPTSNNPWDDWTCTGSELTWHIAGGFNEWSTTSNKLPCTIALDANNGYTFKLVASEVWLGNNGTMTREYHEGWEMAQSEDCTLSTDIAGNYQFSFDTKTAKLTVTYPEECLLCGNFVDNWKTTYSIHNKSVTIKNLKAGTYEFKIHRYDATSAYWVSNDGTMTRENCSDWTMYDDVDKNCKITADFDGDYEFTYDRSTGNLSVTYPTAYTVTFSHTPTAAADAPTSSISSGAYVLANTSLTFTAQNAKTGYTWNGWYSNNAGSGTALSANQAYTTSITANTTIYAVYTANTYTVAFNANGGTGTMSNQNFTYGTDQNLTANTFTRTGYNFAGWNTKADGTGTSYTDKQSVNNLTSTNGATVTLYAQWSPAQYTINYKDQGNATFTGNHATGYPKQHTYGTATTLKTATKTGYTFAGWFTTQDCSGSAITVLDATAYTAAITLYAKWIELPPTTVYLKPVDYWLEANARFAVYAWNNSGNEWIEMEDVGCNREYFSAEIPAQYQDFIFVRINPAATELSFANDVAWNKTPDLTIPTDGKNLLIYPRMYLKPNSNWTADNARSSAYFFEDGKESKWMSMYKDGDYYYCQVPGEDHANMIFARMNPATPDNNFNDGVCWNKTVDLAIEGNCYTLSGALNELSGTWSTRWTTYSEPKYSVTLNATSNGTTTVTCGSDEATSKGSGTSALSDLSLNELMTFTFTPAEGYQFANAKITIGNQELEVFTSTFEYPICGPATVSAHFVSTETRKVYLRPNDEWMINSPIFAAYAYKNESDAHQWYVMNTEDTDYTGAYSCEIPTTYDHVHFVRINPRGQNIHNQGINWANAWNQTIDLEIVNQIYDTENKKRFVIEGQTTKDGKNPNHYDGAWEENTPIWGVTASFNNWHAEKAVFMGYPGKLNIILATNTHEFKLYNFSHNHYYSNTGTYQRANNNQQWWTMDLHNDQGNNCKVITDMDIESYLFQLQLVTEDDTYKKQLSITYPEYVRGAYRLAYKDDSENSFHPARYIRYNADKETHLDTISFFVNKDQNPQVLLQYTTDTDVYSASPNWENLSSHLIEDISTTGVYNFVVKQTNISEEHSVELETSTIHPYTGNYYIRTAAADGGWNEFRQEGNLMTYNSYADNYENFNHYYCKWIEQGNVKFTIANDYSYCISDTLIGDDLITPEGNLPVSSNVRFGWDSNTNQLTRAYILGSNDPEVPFLQLIGKSIQSKAGNEVTTIKFEDKNNWIYQMDVQANTSSEYKVVAPYNGKDQYFKGNAGDGEYVKLLNSSTSTAQSFRLIYNFKSNHMVISWLPESENQQNIVLDADIMIIREDQGDAQQIKLAENQSLSNVKTAYATMTFSKDHIEGKNDETEWERLYYWVSFPFDVKISDVFGFGEYGKQWVIQYYDGAARARDGYYLETPTYWRMISDTTYNPNATGGNVDANGNPNNGVMVANHGYILALAKSIANHNLFQHGNTSVSLYFPSMYPINTIKAETQTTTAILQPYTCTVPGREAYDSHWHVIGAPSYANQTVSVKQDNLFYFYAYNAKSNTYEVKSTGTMDFNSMHSYMVQYAGQINWNAETAIGPEQIAARRNADYEEKVYNLGLQLLQNDVPLDQTFIRMQEDKATTEFDMNLDLTKIINSGANIYSLAGTDKIKLAGNVLPVANTTIPLGVIVRQAGDYTFSMPAGTDGAVVELIDYETNTRTNLLLSDYTVNIPAGTHTNRFALRVEQSKIATGIDSVQDNAAGINKYIINGQMIIMRDGMMYNTTGQKL